MPINDLSQKRNLLGKIGLGVPQMSSNIRIGQQNPQQPPQPMPQPKPVQPNPAPAKPGCGGCRRKRQG